jgi:mRNA interferase RelE/StbE
MILESRFRLRVGDFRLIYAVFENEVIVYIIEVGHRKEIYRD